MKEYLFTSERLGFRNWQLEDLYKMVRISSNPEVMKFFPEPATVAQTEAFITRMQQQYQERGHCYFAVDDHATDEFIGFIGLSYQDFPSPYTPFIDIGWRLAAAQWHKGYATEGATRCLTFGFDELEISEIYSVAPLINRKSWHIMEKLGMEHVDAFNHPKLKGHPSLAQCVLYKKKRQ